jgi:two-component system cell cycle response regulator DivK
MVLTVPASHRFPIPSALLVEPDDDTYGLYELILQDAVNEIRRAEDGPTALAAALSVPPSMVITDVVIPRFDGIDLVTLLRNDPATAAVPIVVTTTDPRPGVAMRARSAGADAVLVKPFLIDELVVTVRRVVEASDPARARSNNLSQHTAPTGLTCLDGRTSRRMVRDRTPTLLTTSPRHVPPELVCPTCDRRLVYGHSFMGGVAAAPSEQWDYFTCPTGCGTFQYRHRTRKSRRIS